MAEIYSSLYKGKVHITTPFSSSHLALDMGNYKVGNFIYSPLKLGKGKITKIATTDTYKGVTYKGCWNVWVKYDYGREALLVHGYEKDGMVKVGDVIRPGDKFYKTGSSGYSTGDHLHFQLKINDKAVDPSSYVLNDDVDLLPIGTRLYFKEDMNLRDEQGNNTVIGVIKKGAVCEIITYRGHLDGYWRYGVQFLDGTKGVVAKTSNNTVNESLTKNLTNIDGSGNTQENNNSTVIDALKTQIRQLETQIKQYKIECERLQKYEEGVNQIKKIFDSLS